MSTQLIFGRDAQGYNALCPQFSTDLYSAQLAGNAGSTITVPSSASAFMMSIRLGATSIVWVSRNDSAAPPVGSTFATITSDLATGAVPYDRVVYAGDVISIFSIADNTQISVAFYAIS